MKLGWLHDKKNEQKWDWCRRQRDLGRIVGMQWYVTDVDGATAGGIAADLADNYASAFTEAIAILDRWDVIGRGRHFTKSVPRDRTAWTREAVEYLRGAGCTAVLLDPDTGIATGKTWGRQHVTVWEVVAFAEAFDEIAVFQHTQRAGGDQHQLMIRRTLDELTQRGREIHFTEVLDQHFLVVVR